MRAASTRCKILILRAPGVSIRTRRKRLRSVIEAVGEDDFIKQIQNIGHQIAEHHGKWEVGYHALRSTVRSLSNRLSSIELTSSLSTPRTPRGASSHHV